MVTIRSIIISSRFSRYANAPEGARPRGYFSLAPLAPLSHSRPRINIERQRPGQLPIPYQHNNMRSFCVFVPRY